MKTEKLRSETSVEKWPGRAIPMATSVLNPLGIRLPPFILALTFGLLLAIVPAGDAAAQTLQTIGTLLIPGVTQQPNPVFSAGVKYTLPPGGRIIFSAFTLTKQVNAISPKILESAASGRHFPQAKIDLFKPDGTTALTSYELTDVVVMGASLDSVQDGKKPVLIEEIVLDYKRIKQTVFTASGAVIGCWDKAQNRSC